MKWRSIFLCHFVLTSITGSCHNSPFQVLWTHASIQKCTVPACGAIVLFVWIFGQKYANFHISILASIFRLYNFSLPNWVQCSLLWTVILIVLLSSFDKFITNFSWKENKQIKMKEKIFLKQMHLLETIGVLIFFRFESFNSDSSLWKYLPKKIPTTASAIYCARFVHV